jgi:purine-nucleoside phosphorylase
MATDTFQAFAAAARAARPQVAVVLGSGMGEVVRGLDRQQDIAFRDIPGLPAASVAGHRGRLALGTWAGMPVLVFEGRLHYYESHSWDTVVTPVRTAHALDVPRLLLTNAAGGIHDDVCPGALMVIRDHIDWTRPYCWRAPGPSGLGPNRPSPYAEPFAQLVLDAGRAQGIVLHQGTYAALTGPCYETPAEIQALKTWGADAVGMSTAREVEAGAEMGLTCAAISCITNRAAGLGPGPLNHQEVLATAAQQSDRLRQLLERVIRSL